MENIFSKIQSLISNNISYSEFVKKFEELQEGEKTSDDNDNDKSIFSDFTKSDIQQIFENFDINGDGKLEESEFSTYQENYSKDINNVFEYMTQDMSEEDFDKIFEKYQSLSNFDNNMIGQFFDCADSNNDGKIDKEELEQFEKKFINSNPTQETPEVKNTPQSTASGSSGGVGGTYSSGDMGSVTTQENSGPKEYSDMNLSELESAKSTAESELSTAQSELDTAQQQEVTAQNAYDTAETNAEKKYTEMQNLNTEMQNAIEQDKNITEKQKTALAEIEENLNTNQEAIETTKTSISSTESSITQKESEITQKESSITQKESAISAQQSTISDLYSQLQNVSSGSTDEERQAAIEKRQQLKSQISSAQQKMQELESEKAQLEQEKNNLETEKQALESKLSELEGTKAELDTEQTEILNQKTNLLTEISTNATDATKDIINNYQQAQNNYETAKTELTTAKETLDTAKQKTTEAKSTYETKKANLEQINSLIATKQAEKASKISDEGSVEIPDFIPDSDKIKIQQLHPEMQEVMVEFFEKAKEAGLEFTLECGGQVRTLGYQEELHNRNSSRYGTPNPYGTSSFHLLGLAVDITPKGCSYEQLATIGKSVGLSWGGDWQGYKEGWHFQLDSGVRSILNDPSLSDSEKEEEIAERYPCIKTLYTSENSSYESTEFYTAEELAQRGYSI